MKAAAKTSAFGRAALLAPALCCALLWICAPPAARAAEKVPECGPQSALFHPFRYADRKRLIEEYSGKLKGAEAPYPELENALGWQLAMDNRFEEAAPLFDSAAARGCYQALEGQILVALNRSDYLNLSYDAIEAAERAPSPELAVFYLKLFYDFFYQADIRDAADRLLAFVKREKVPEPAKINACFFLKENYPFERELMSAMDEACQTDARVVGEYLATGVFRKYATGDIDVPFGPEEFIKEDGYAAMTAPVGWVALKTPPFSRSVQPFEELQPTLGGVVYLLTYAYSDEAQRVEFEAGAIADALKIDVNGTEAYARRPADGTKRQSDGFSLQLEKGWNRFLIKMRQDQGLGNFSLTWMRPAHGLKFRAGLDLESKWAGRADPRPKLLPSEADAFFSKVPNSPLKSLYMAIDLSRDEQTDAADQAILDRQADYGDSLIFKHAQWLTWSFFYIGDSEWRPRMAKSVLEEIAAKSQSGIAEEYLAVNLQDNRSYDESAQAHKRLAEMTGGRNSFAWLGLYHAWSEKGVPTLAWENLLKAYELNTVDSRFIWPWIQREIENGRIPAAKVSYEAFYRAQPFHYKRAYGYADFLTEYGFFDEAQTLLDRLEEVYGPLAEVKLRKAKLAWLRGDAEKARGAIAELIEWNPYRPDFYSQQAGLLIFGEPSPDLNEAREAYADYSLADFWQAMEISEKDPTRAKLLDAVRSRGGVCPAPAGGEDSGVNDREAPVRYLVREEVRQIDERFRETRRRHEMILIQREEGIEQFRELTLPDQYTQILELRTLNPSGHESRAFASRRNGADRVWSIPDLQVGSILEYDYVQHTLPLLWFSGELAPAQSALAEYYAPTDSSLFGIAAPADLKLEFKTLGEGANDSAPTVVSMASRPDEKIYIWKSCGGRPGTADAFMPDERLLVKRALAGSYTPQKIYDLWSREIVKTGRATPIVRAAALAAAGDEPTTFGKADILFERARDISNEGDAESAEEALVMGSGGALQRTLLLRAMLKTVGINSRLALTYGRSAGPEGDALSPLIAYYHPLLKIELDGGKTVWADLNSRWLSLGQIHFNAMETEAIVFGDRGPTLERLPGLGPKDRIDTTAECAVDKNEKIRCRAVVEATGAFATLRDELLNHESVASAVEGAIPLFVPGAENIGAPEIANLEDPRGPLQISAEFETTHLLQKGEDGTLALRLDWPALSSIDYFNVAPDRTLPIHVGYPVAANQTLRIRLPEGLTVAAPPPETAAMENLAGSYSRRVELGDRELLARRTITLPPQTAEGERLADFLALAQFVNEAEQMGMTFEYAGANGAAEAKSEAQTAPKNASPNILKPEKKADKAPDDWVPGW